MGAPSLGDVAEAPEDKPPLMVDLFCGPNLPLGKAFLYCGWRCLPVDWALDPSHDLSNPQRQDSIREQLQDAVFAAAALDCSTKSRAREIPRDLGDGKPGRLAPPYGIFPLQPALPISLEDVFFDCEARNSEIRASLKPGPHDEFLLSQSVAEADAVPRRLLGASF